MSALTPIERPRYAAYLARVLALFEAIEPALWSACARFVPDAGQRFKSDWLRADLKALGASAASTNATAHASFELGGALEALGAAYVIEGSTLGGPVLLARLRAAGVVLDRERGGARFLSGYGAQNAAMWRAFRAALQAAALDAHDWPRIERGALAMFRAYERAITGAGAP